MTKSDIKIRLQKGEYFTDMMKLSDGQDCKIVKEGWSKNIRASLNDVIYVPDISLNGLTEAVNAKDPSKEQIENIISYCYTVKDFLKECYGNVKLAQDLFLTSDWQHPNVQDLIDCTYNDEAKQNYGETWNRMFRREDGIRAVRDTLYHTYQLDWLSQHGMSVNEVIRLCEGYAKDILAEGAGGSEDIVVDFTEDFSESGFDGEIYASQDEFLMNEYQDRDYALELLRHSAISGAKYQRYYLDDVEGFWEDPYGTELHLFPMIQLDFPGKEA